MLNRKIRSIILVLVFSFLIFSFVKNNIEAEENENSNHDIYRNLELISQVLSQLDKNYAEEINIDSLTEAAIEGVLDELDPHTVFFTKEELEDFQSDTKGEFGGLGISIDKQDEYITVISPIEGTPAERAGILPGDKIVKVNGKSIKGLPTEKVIDKMRGPRGTEITITINRPGAEGNLDFTIIRDIIKIDSIPYVYKMDNGLGYIKINKFNRHTAKDFNLALDQLEEKGIRGLIIDLRYNPGGLLDQVIETVNEFVGKGKKVVYTKGKNERAEREYYTEIDRIRTGYPVVVMINHLSASASEIFAGSMQDWDKGLVVGKTSFGKGSVQQVIPLVTGDGLKLTIAKYYIHSGRCINKDQDKEDKENKEKKVYYTDNNRKVYGGGGITPDIAIEQNKLSETELKLRNKNLIFKYALEEYKPKNGDEISLDLEIDDKIFNDFVSYLNDQELKIKPEKLDSLKSRIKTRLKAEIIGSEFGKMEKHKIISELDHQLQETINIFNKCQTLEEMFKYAKEIRKNEKEQN